MWFVKDKQLKRVETVEKDSKIEVIAHKKATKQQINNVKKANDQLNSLLTENGFTLKIYLAAGGRHAHLKSK